MKKDYKHCNEYIFGIINVVIFREMKENKVKGRKARGYSPTIQY